MNKIKIFLKNYLSYEIEKNKLNFVFSFCLLSTAILKFNKSQSRFTIDNPKPVPLISGCEETLERKKELKILFSQPPSLAKCYEADSLEKNSNIT